MAKFCSQPMAPTFLLFTVGDKARRVPHPSCQGHPLLGPPPHLLFCSSVCCPPNMPHAVTCLYHSWVPPSSPPARLCSKVTFPGRPSLTLSRATVCPELSTLPPTVFPWLWSRDPSSLIMLFYCLAEEGHLQGRIFFFSVLFPDIFSCLVLTIYLLNSSTIFSSELMNEIILFPSCSFDNVSL